MMHQTVLAGQYTTMMHFHLSFYCWLFAATLPMLAHKTHGLEEKLQECAHRTGFNVSRAEKLIAFRIQDDEIKQEDKIFLVCCMELYDILGNTGGITDDATLEKKYKGHLDNFEAFIDALKSAPFKDTPADYAFELYKAMRGFAEKHTMLLCGRENHLDIVTVKQIKAYNLTNIEANRQDKVKKFILCALKKQGVLTEDGDLTVDLKKIFSKGDDKLVKSLKETPLDPDKEEYAFRLYKNIADWKAGVESGKSNSNRYSNGCLMWVFLSTTFAHFMTNI